MTQPLWVLENLTLRGRERPRLNGLSLKIEPGLTALMGCSGAGKSSLLNVLAGFEPPDSGTIRFNGVDRNGNTSDAGQPEGATDRNRNQQNRLPLFWSPQDHGLWPHLSVLEHLEQVRPRSPQLSITIPEWLDRFRLGALQSARPDRLSQGERARLSLVRALCSEAAVLILDEPFAHSDPVHARSDLEMLDTTARQLRMSVVFSTHDGQSVLRFATSVICLRDGELAFNGSVDDLYFRPTDRELAWMLGPANWIEPDSQNSELRAGEFQNWPSCVRPEELTLHNDDDGPFSVVGRWNTGALEEVELARFDRMNDRQRFFLLRQSIAQGRVRLEFEPSPRR